MKLSQLTSSDLQRLAKLIAERDLLIAKLSEIETHIDAFAGGEPTAPRKRGRPPQIKSLTETLSPFKPVKGRRGPKKGEKPGRLKGAILRALEEAGSHGLSVGELSEKLKVKANNLYSWFYTTGRKVQKLKKADGKYTYNP